MLDDICLRIEPGERIGLVGASGSGKTTLAFLIARFYDPTSGTVRLDGVDLRELQLNSLRTAVNVVFEDSFLFSASIRENIAFARPDASDEDIEAAARVAQAHDFILELSHGYDTEVGEHGFTLSGGQRQRIALARAALANPPVLILDDATSAIDARTEEKIHASLAAELGSRTTVLIAHRSSTLRLADRVIVIDGGRIVAEGSNAELWHTSELYRELLTGPDLEPLAADTAPVDSLDPRAWPRQDHNGDGRAHRVDLASMYAAMALGGGGGGGGIGVRAGLVAATPELLERVAELPPLRGDPEVDLAEATAESDRLSLGRLVHRFKWALVGVAVLVGIDAATTLVGPLLIRRGLDYGVQMHDARTLVNMCLAFLAVQLLSWGNQIVELLHTSHTSERMLYTLRARTFAHLQRLSLDYYDREMGGRIMTRMTTDVEALAQLLQQGLLLALTSIVSCVGVVVILLVLDVRLALAAFVVLPVLAVATVWFQRGSRRSYLRARDAISTVNAELQESVSGVRVTQALGREDNNAARFTRRSMEYRNARLKSMQLMSVYFATSQLLSTIAKATTLWFGARLVGENALSTGLLIAFLLYLDQFFAPMQQLSAVFDQWIQARISLGRLDELLATPTSTPEPATPLRPLEWIGDVRLENVRFAYSADAPEALRGVDLEIRPGETVALVGTTGAGKSTFVKLVARFYDPTAGRVVVDGLDLRQVDLHDYRHHIGYVPQEPFLFSGTIKTNIAYGRPERDRPRDRAGGARRRRPRARGVDAERLPHAGRRGGPVVVGRPEAAAVPGSGAARRPQHPHPRRGDVEPRPGDRGPGAAGDERGRAGPHDAADRPSPADRTPRLTHHRGGGRRRRGGRLPRRAGGRRRPLRRALGRLRPRHVARRLTPPRHLPGACHPNMRNSRSCDMVGVGAVSVDADAELVALGHLDEDDGRVVVGVPVLREDEVRREPDDRDREPIGVGFGVDQPLLGDPVGVGDSPPTSLDVLRSLARARSRRLPRDGVEVEQVEASPGEIDHLILGIDDAAVRLRHGASLPGRVVVHRGRRAGVETLT